MPYYPIIKNTPNWNHMKKNDKNSKVDFSFKKIFHKIQQFPLRSDY